MIAPIEPQKPFRVMLLCAVDYIYTRAPDTWEWYERQIKAMEPYMTPATMDCVRDRMEWERKWAERKNAITQGRPMAEEEAAQ